MILRVFADSRKVAEIIGYTAIGCSAAVVVALAGAAARDRWRLRANGPIRNLNVNVDIPDAQLLRLRERA